MVKVLLLPSVNFKSNIRRILIDPKSDQELVALIRSGQEEYIKHLYKIGRESITRYVNNNNGSRDEAEEVISETIIIIYQKIIDDNFQLTSSLKTFIMGVAKNLWYKELRAKGLLARLPEEIFDLEFERDKTDMTEDRIRSIEDAIKSLDEKCQEILKMRFWFKWRFETIAEKLNMTQENAKMKSSRCHKGLSNKIHLKC
jgi:RNA polymerase sigma factor (sigma-70 family)